MGQTTIFNFVEKPKSKEYLVIERIPQFVDVDLSYKGPYFKGDIIKEGEVSDALIRTLLYRGFIVPKGRRPRQ